MPKKKYTGPSTDFLNEVVQSAAVRQALENRAARALPAAKAVALSSGADAFAQALHVETGTRPGTEAREGLKRSYARVTATVTPEMKRADAAAKLTRQKILRRGAING